MNGSRPLEVGFAARRMELLVPNDPGTRFVAAEIFRSLCYRPVEGMPAPKAILDIGANVGLATAFFRLAYPAAAIHCVEPDPNALRFLRENAARAGNCQVHPVGLYDRDCTMPLNASSNTALSSLGVNQSAQAAPTPIEVQIRDAGRFVRELGIAFDLLKIDTEGVEVQIVRSLGAAARAAATIHFEFHSDSDRRLIDDLLHPTHLLWRASLDSPHRGNLAYVARDRAPALKGPLKPLVLL
jgi:FkbM family methyltransferase